MGENRRDLGYAPRARGEHDSVVMPVVVIVLVVVVVVVVAVPVAVVLAVSVLPVVRRPTAPALLSNFSRRPGANQASRQQQSRDE